MAFTCRTRSGYDQVQHNHARTAQTLPSALQAYPFFTMSIKPPDLARRNLYLFEVWTFGCLPQARAVAVWWSQTGSNRRPPACKAGALPTELWPRLEPATHPVATFQAVIFKKIQPPREWWAWKDLNFRPHAYQARALTN